MKSANVICFLCCEIEKKDFLEVSHEFLRMINIFVFSDFFTWD